MPCPESGRWGDFQTQVFAGGVEEGTEASERRPRYPAPGEAGSTGAGLAAAEKAVISGLIISRALCVRGGEG